MHITPIHPDYITADLNDLKIAEIFRHQENLAGLIEEGKLCGDDGRFIILELGFKGDTNAVIKQMEQHIQNLKDNALTDSDRVPMQQAYMNACTQFALENDELEYTEEFRKAMVNGDTDLMIDIHNKSKELKTAIHDRKECLCYIND